MDQLISLLAFGIFAVLWVAFVVAIVASQGSLDAAWKWIGELPTALQVAVWLLFLPVVGGLWVWESAWPYAARIAVVAVLAIGTLYAFLPKWIFEGRGQ